MTQRLTAAILVTREAEIRRIAVRSQPGQTVHETLKPITTKPLNSKSDRRFLSESTGNYILFIY
jgi:hypothetical protein